jgi:hypothetical protein
VRPVGPTRRLIGSDPPQDGGAKDPHQPPNSPQKYALYGAIDPRLLVSL